MIQVPSFLQWCLLDWTFQFLPCDWSLPAQPISMRKAQSRKKAHEPLCTSWISQKNVCAMFDNQTYMLFTDWEVRIEKNFAEGLECTNRGSRPWHSWPRAKLFSRPVNNRFICSPEIYGLPLTQMCNKKPLKSQSPDWTWKLTFILETSIKCSQF